ncbi:39S ribosomal protein L19, mitochondrial [Aplysia californica]|uniref:Large ribosomal subunit protein bL19m n=1 Tax=Aplysia californica TaxID=6500 RepID=A0ABM0JGT3_APLCA|nr:39S ribosomal protein L19, mitochondrial [Aplysia californica]
MATSLGLNALRLSLSVLRPSSCAVVPCQLTVAHKSHNATHVINYRRTRAEMAKAIRRKQNFLHFELVDKHRHSPLQTGTENISQETEVTAPRNYRYVMPEFMPRPDWERRDRVLEKLERRDMMRRRAIMNIPEFYVGSIMAVTVADAYAPSKKNRFVGICIDRGEYGLKAYFVLRNVVDGLGVEVMYEMYNPKVLSIEVLKLEKRLDDQLYYLRDALPEYSTFSFDMEPVQLPKGADVPLNTTKVKLKPTKEWECRWEAHDLQGVQPFEVNEKRMRRKEKSAEPWKKHDLMLDYRSRVPEEEEEQVMAEVFREKQVIDSQRKSMRTVLKKRK